MDSLPDAVSTCRLTIVVMRTARCHVRWKAMGFKHMVSSIAAAAVVVVFAHC